MKQLVLLSVLFFFSCELPDPVEKNEFLEISKADILGPWKLIDTLFAKSTNAETDITTEYKFNEIYTFTNDHKFEISDKSLFIFCDNGSYGLDITTNQINFTCDLVKVEIDGHPIILESEAKKMKWNIIDLIGDTLHVDAQYFDRPSQTYSELIRKRYLKK